MIDDQSGTIVVRLRSRCPPGCHDALDGALSMLASALDLSELSALNPRPEGSHAYSVAICPGTRLHFAWDPRHGAASNLNIR